MAEDTIKQKTKYIFEYFGYPHQIIKLDEEVKELQEALIVAHKEPSKNDVEHVIEEIADVMVIINQFKQHFKISDRKIKEIVDFKTRRTVTRIKSGYYAKKPL